MENNNDNPFKFNKRDVLFDLLKNLLDNKIKVLEDKNIQNMNDLQYSKKNVEILTKNCQYYNLSVKNYIKKNINNKENNRSRALSKEFFHIRGVSRDMINKRIKTSNKVNNLLINAQKEKRTLTPTIKLHNNKKRPTKQNSKILNKTPLRKINNNISSINSHSNRNKTPIKSKDKILKNKTNINLSKEKKLNVNKNSINSYSRDNSLINSVAITAEHRKTFSGVIDNFLNNDDELLTSIDTDSISRSSNVLKLKKFSLMMIFVDENFIHIIKYLKLKDLFQCILINKTIGRNLMKEIIFRCNTKLLNLIKDYEKEKNSIDNFIIDENRLKIKFELSHKSIKALELLNEELYLEFFNNTKRKKPSENIIKIYKLLIQLMNKTGTDIEVSNLILLFHNDEKFWSNLSKYIISNSDGKLGNFILNQINKLDFSIQNLEKVIELVKPMIYLLNPTNFTKDNPTTALIVFALKDIVEYLGFTNSNIEYFQKLKIYITKYKQFQEKNNKLKLIFHIK